MAINFNDNFSGKIRTFLGLGEKISREIIAGFYMLNTSNLNEQIS